MEKEITEILQEIQKTLVAPKGQYNDFGKYKYRSCEDVLEALKPLLTASLCSLTINDEIVLIGDRYYVKATATLWKGKNSISISAYAREPKERKGMDESQITGATSSYARKYALNGLFAIDDNKDPDSTNDHGKEKKDDVQKHNENLSRIFTPPEQITMRSVLIGEANKKFKSPDEFKVWRIDMGFAEDLDSLVVNGKEDGIGFAKIIRGVQDYKGAK